MNYKDLLIEIGSEEIPAGYIRNAMKQLQQSFSEQLVVAKLDFSKLQLFSTPRRLALRICDLQTEQKDEIIELVGPPRKIAYDDEGNLTKAGKGFLRNANANAEDLYLKKNKKGDKIAIQKKISGKRTEEIIIEILENFLKKVSFPKKMKWGNSTLDFARPLRWILLLFGNKVIEFSYDTLKADRLSFGNRYPKLITPIEIAEPKDYEKSLHQVKVIAARNERKTMIEKQINKILIQKNKKLVNDNKLLDIVTDLVEYPTAVLAHFDQEYLTLPDRVVISTLSEHQKYFAVQDDAGLTNNFIFIANGDPHFSDLIRKGNEKVIEARLSDAKFFFDEDTKLKLEAYLPKLQEVTFQEKLGSLWEKTKRIEKLAEFICDELSVEKTVKQYSLRAAKLCKADLVTLMLGEKEFTKLQGYIGHRYALHSGEEKEVALAIEEHYGYQIENISKAGAIVAIADQIDTICGIIGVGIIPTGSRDPFALRRAAQNLVQIIAEKNFDINLQRLIQTAFSILNDKINKSKKEFVTNFFQKRVEWLLKQKKIDYDIIDSVTHISFANIPDLIKRAKALQKLKRQEHFIRLVLGFKRVSNIILDTEIKNELKQDLLIEDQEKHLHKKYLELHSEIDHFLKEKNYDLILQKLVQFGQEIDKFFDEVLVNIDDEALKRNRYELLNMIRQLFLQVADISKIVIEGEEKR